MKKMTQKLSIMIVIVVGVASLSAVCSTATYALECETGVDTAIINVECDDEGSGIGNLLQIAITIMTAGVAIAALLGISIASFQYATAGGNEERVKKSKDRILQIVIGILVYGMLWAALQWLMPGGVLRP
jgi:hypothetical protein